MSEAEVAKVTLSVAIGAERGALTTSPDLTRTTVLCEAVVVVPITERPRD